MSYLHHEGRVKDSKRPSSNLTPELKHHRHPTTTFSQHLRNAITGRRLTHTHALMPLGQVLLQACHLRLEILLSSKLILQKMRNLRETTILLRDQRIKKRIAKESLHTPKNYRLRSKPTMRILDLPHEIRAKVLWSACLGDHYL